MEYRREVDGLRAVAVLPVIAFHAGVPFVPGGYLGVDVFFVVSGYLITALIVRELGEGRFSVRTFLMRRVRRIQPALLVMIATCVPFAWWLMIPDDLENFGQSMVATALMANNVLGYLTSDYFAAEAQFKPLIHSWSLGVEEQYYLVVPLAMLAAFRLGGRRAIVAGLVVAGVASLALALWLAGLDPTANFYLLPSRGWELAAGSLVAFGEPRWRGLAGRSAPWLALAGLGGLVACFATVREGGVTAILLPVAATCVVLASARRDDFAGRLLGAGPVVAVGLVSYSLYLWHQPVFAFVRIASLDAPSPWLLIALTPGVFGLAWLSWRFVERPCRDVATVPTRSLLLGVIGATAAIVGVGLALHATSGLRSMWPELGDGGRGARQDSAYNLRVLAISGRLLPDDGGPNLLVLGNSFARDFVNMAIDGGGVAPGRIGYQHAGECARGPDAVLAEQARRASVIVLASGAGVASVRCLRAGVAALRRTTEAHVLVLGTKGFGWNNNAVMRLPPERRYAYRALPVEDVLADSAAGRQVFDAATYIDLLAMIEDPEGRVPVFTPDRRFISQDRKHLTPAGARWLGGIVFADPRLAAFKQ